jgi:hypothetical protein
LAGMSLGHNGRRRRVSIRSTKSFPKLKNRAE